MTLVNLSGANWFTSSHSGDISNTCVEVAANIPAIVAVRDCTNPAPRHPNKRGSRHPHGGSLRA